MTSQTESGDIGAVTSTAVGSDETTGETKRVVEVTETIEETVEETPEGETIVTETVTTIVEPVNSFTTTTDATTTGEEDTTNDNSAATEDIPVLTKDEQVDETPANKVEEEEDAPLATETEEPTPVEEEAADADTTPNTDTGATLEEQQQETVAAAVDPTPTQQPDTDDTPTIDVVEEATAAVLDQQVDTPVQQEQIQEEQPAATTAPVQEQEPETPAVDEEPAPTPVEVDADIAQLDAAEAEANDGNQQEYTSSPVEVEVATTEVETPVEPQQQVTEEVAPEVEITPAVEEEEEPVLETETAPTELDVVVEGTITPAFEDTADEPEQQTGVVVSLVTDADAQVAPAGESYTEPEPEPVAEEQEETTAIQTTIEVPQIAAVTTEVQEPAAAEPEAAVDVTEVEVEMSPPAEAELNEAAAAAPEPEVVVREDVDEALLAKAREDLLAAQENYLKANQEVLESANEYLLADMDESLKEAARDAQMVASKKWYNFWEKATRVPKDSKYDTCTGERKTFKEIAADNEKLLKDTLNIGVPEEELAGNQTRWKKVTDKQGVLVQVTPTEAGKMYKLSTTINAPPRVVLLSLVRGPILGNSDKDLYYFREHYNFVGGRTSLVHTIREVSSYGSVLPRDFVDLTHWSEDEDGNIFYTAQSVIAIQTKMPRGKCVRGNTLFFGVAIKKTENGMSDVSMLSKVKVNGWVPQFVIDWNHPSVLLKQMKNLEKAAKEIVETGDENSQKLVRKFVFRELNVE